MIKINRELVSFITLLQTYKLMVLVIVLVSASSLAQEKVAVKIAAIDWCPQLCLSEDAPGYVNEILSSIYPPEKYRLSIEYFPWSRAIKLVDKGDFQVLLAPAKEEAPNLNYPSNPIGIQQMCFFTRSDSSWSYTNVDSLKGLNIGIARDTSIEELNTFRASHSEQFQVQTYLDRYIEQSTKKLMKGRVDTFVFTKNTTLYELKRLALDKEIKVSGCMPSAPIYAGFSPVSHHQKDSKNMIKEFDIKVHQLAESGELELILEKYQVGFSGDVLISFGSKSTGENEL